MLLTLLKTFWKEIAAVAAISILLYGAYDWAYDRGYHESSVEWQVLVKEREDARDQRIGQIEQSSIKLLELTLLNTDKTSKDIRGIKLPEGKPPTIIVGKDCIPSTEYVEAYNAAIKRGNK